MVRKLPLALLAGCTLLLAGCNSLSSFGDQMAASVGLEDDQPKAYTSSVVSQPQRGGIAVSDEPLAARAGAAVLASYGNAVDAVTTMFFTLSATYPVAAGLGGGGICLVREAQANVSEFDFLIRTPRRGGAYGVPAAVRGFAQMQRIYGSLPWQRMVASGEAYAATGFPISLALYTRLVDAQNIVRQDKALSAEFLDGSGRLLPAGSQVRNLELSQTLSQIRLDGGDGFYKGAVGADIAAYADANGGAITSQDLSDSAVRQISLAPRRLGEVNAYVPGTGTGSGAFTSSLLSTLSRQRLGGAFAFEALPGTLARFGVARLPRDLGSTGFAAVDANGGAASCAVTLNGPFGSGHTVAPAGIQLAASPQAGPAGLASAFLTPVLAANENGIALAGVGAGGPNGTAAAIYALLETANGRHLGKRGDLHGTGAAPFDTVNVISCTREDCVALSDPGAHGLGAVAEAAMTP